MAKAKKEAKKVAKKIKVESPKVVRGSYNKRGK